MTNRKRPTLLIDPVMLIWADLLFQMVVYLLLTATGGGLGVADDGGRAGPPTQAPAVVVRVAADRTTRVDGDREPTDRADLAGRVAERCKGVSQPTVHLRCAGVVPLNDLRDIQQRLKRDAGVAKVVVFQLREY